MATTPMIGLCARVPFFKESLTFHDCSAKPRILVVIVVVISSGACPKDVLSSPSALISRDTEVFVLLALSLLLQTLAF
jgi:hypothetical protein